jgi:predicted PurR-regulated permease PerM
MMTPFFILLVMMIFGGLFWGWTGATLAFALLKRGQSLLKPAEQPKT